jgi:Dolichyl-phosphate-mannose-protein mannosyltransferase
MARRPTAIRLNCLTPHANRRFRQNLRSVASVLPHHAAMKAAAVSVARTAVPSLFVSDRFAMPRVAATVAVIATVIALAFGLRAADLSTYGFSEDEINKVRAIETYRAGHLSANGEHPMLMKLAMLASVEASRTWNRVAPAEAAIAIETAVRLPNAVVGAAIAAALFAVCNVLFGPAIATMAALLWAFDVNAIAINRIGKEDTFALFFFLVAVWCYEVAKQQGGANLVVAQRWYTAAGAAFGLMLASKYFPQYLGVYALFNVLTNRTPGENRPLKLRYYGAMVAAFVVANVAILAPATWQYGIAYLCDGTLVHHGYPFAGRLYPNTKWLWQHGVPVTFYLRMLATKVPLVVLGAVVPGAIELLRRRRERGFALVAMWFGLFFVGYSLSAVKFIRYALPLFAAIDIVAAIGVVAGIRWLLRKSWLLPITRVTFAGLALTVCVSGAFLAARSAAPFPSLFRNGIGEVLAPAGATFPEETYDFGVREAVAAIAPIAQPGAAIISDAPNVVSYYVGLSGRPDLRVRSLSTDGLPRDGRPSFVIVQPEHLTFENQELVAKLAQTRSPWRVFRAADAIAARVYVLPRS